MIRFVTIATYVAICVLANVLTNKFGLQPIGFGLVATAGTLMAGLAFLARDVAQEVTDKYDVPFAMLGAALLSWVFANPAIATASFLAFLFAESADYLVYTRLRRRGLGVAMTTSQVVGLVLDTLLFLWVAGFPITQSSVFGQFVGKSYALLLIIPVILFARKRDLLRNAKQS